MCSNEILKGFAILFIAGTQIQPGSGSSRSGVNDLQTGNEASPSASAGKLTILDTNGSFWV